MIVNASSILQQEIKIKNGITKHFNMNEQIIISAKMIIVRILDMYVWEQQVFKEYYISGITCDEIFSVMDSASRKMTNTLTTNVSINCHT